MAAFDPPRGTGPYRIATTPDGQVLFASLGGKYLGPANAKPRGAFEADSRGGL